MQICFYTALAVLVLLIRNSLLLYELETLWYLLKNCMKPFSFTVKNKILIPLRPLPISPKILVHLFPHLNKIFPFLLLVYFPLLPLPLNSQNQIVLYSRFLLVNSVTNAVMMLRNASSYFLTFVLNDLLPIMSPPPPTQNPWIVDSGASHHVTSQLSNLSLTQSYEGPDDIIIGDGSGFMHREASTPQKEQA
ncbi:uncharacterized protein LOC112091187 [Morus notabilis]|uniref:uncharacterized protein LOC112091187 n=1 Tax=Morus notabilis TaxID=981085 RepID=UPI000CED013F|nr:uncharacterized protein LOC112091187 [Morus notabilis]